MSYGDREEHKDLARKLLSEATSAEGRARAVFMLIQAYFHRNTDAPSFEAYASHWLLAAQGAIPGDALRLLLRRFPFPKRPSIQSGYTDWGSYGRPGYIRPSL